MLTQVTFVEYEDWKQEALYRKSWDEVLREKDNVIYRITRLLWPNEFALLQNWKLEEVSKEITRQIEIIKSQMGIILPTMNWHQYELNV